MIRRDVTGRPIRHSTDRPCANCGGEVLWWGVGRRPVYCSDECRRRVPRRPAGADPVDVSAETRSAAALEILRADPSRTDAAIARELGVTRALVNAVRHRHQIPPSRSFTAAKKRAEAEAAAIAELDKRIRLAVSQDRRCLICGAWVLRWPAMVVTCSERCSELWESTSVKYRISRLFRDFTKARSGGGRRFDEITWPRDYSETSAMVARVEGLRSANRFVDDWSFVDRYVATMPAVRAWLDRTT